jgi:hypothetical protein
MSKIEYRLISANERELFISRVIHAASEGWECQGGISVVDSNGISTMIYNQAMIKSYPCDHEFKHYKNPDMEYDMCTKCGELKK